MRDGAGAVDVGGARSFRRRHRRHAPLMVPRDSRLLDTFLEKPGIWLQGPGSFGVTGPAARPLRYADSLRATQNNERKLRVGNLGLRYLASGVWNLGILGAGLTPGCLCAAAPQPPCWAGWSTTGSCGPTLGFDRCQTTSSLLETTRGWVAHRSAEAVRVEPTRCAIVAQSRGPSRSTTFRRASSSSSVQLAASLLWRTFAFLKATLF